MEIFNGVFYHAVGASGAALCYTPQKKVRNWSWQTYWLAQAFVCWLLLPMIVAFITVPGLLDVLEQAPGFAMQRSFLLGMAYGVGGTAFGVAIRYVGFSLTYAIAVGISCVLGTLLPPLVAGTLDEVLSGRGAGLLVSGVSTGAMGIMLCGIAGRSKERDIRAWEETEREPGNNEAVVHESWRFSLVKGLPLCLLAGVLSALYGFALDQGQPIADVAARHGAGQFQGNAIYIFSNSGAFVTTLLYCIYLHGKHKTFYQYASNTNGLGVNYLMSALTGVLWYGQFFFYGLGHVRMGSYKFTSWAIHMIMLVMLSSVTGLVLKEWKNCRAGTIRLLIAALAVLLAAILLLTYGNYLGSSEA